MSKQSRRHNRRARPSRQMSAAPPVVEVPSRPNDLADPVLAIFEKCFEHLADLADEGVDIQPILSAMAFMVPCTSAFPSVEQDADLRRMVSYMREAGVDESMIFAYEVTGRIVTEGNRHLLTEDDLDEWFTYVDAYEVFGETARLAFGVPTNL